MNAKVQSIVNQALSLNSKDRISIAEQLLSSLDTPDPAIDEIWAEEVEARIDAFERGEMESVSAKAVFGKYKIK
ncbi:MAG: addiction module protein [Pseudomonadales bacterium]